jgi:hypothetical protein
VTLNYELLGASEAEHIRRQRLLDLEADHFRFVLDLEELPDDADPSPLLARIADVERRIALHRQALSLPVRVTTLDEANSGREFPGTESS